MYTYKLGGMLITDELYHDDLEAMTFGRKDQNELMHYGIKGQSWGKRRFQNEDGSLTMAGRNRYDVGDPLKGVTAFADTGGRGGSGVNYNRLPGGTGGSTRSATANQAPARLVGSNPRGRATTSATTTQKVANTTNAGRKAADSLFGRIGNWASNAAKDVGNFATNTYNDASKAVGNAANAAGSWVGNAVKDVGNLLSNEDEKKAAENAQNRANRALNNAINRSGEYVPDGRGGEDLYIRDANDAKMVDTAEQQAAKAQQRYDDHPVTQVQNAAKDAGNWIGNAFNDAKNWVGNAGRDVGNFATNVYNDASKVVTGAAQDVGNFVKNAPQNISDWYTGDKAGREAQRYDNVVQNFERNGDQNINAGRDIISRGLKYPESAYDLESGQSMRDKTVIEGLDRRNLGYNQHDIARQYGQKADEAQARYDNAPRQLLERAGNWIGDRAQDAKDFINYEVTGNGYRDLAKNWTDYANGVKTPDNEGYNASQLTAEENARKSQEYADNSLLGRIGNTAKNVGDWASNAASDVRDWGAGAVDKGRQAFENLYGGAKSAANAVGEGATKVWNDATGETKRQEQQKEQEYHDTLNNIGDTLRTAKTATERENALRDLISTMDNNDAFRVRSGFQNDTPMSFWAERAKNNLDRIDRLQENLDKGYYTGEAAERAKREIAEAKIDNELTIGNFYNNTNASGRWGPDGLVGNYENTPDNVSQQEWDRYVAENYGHYPNRGRRTISHSMLDDKPSGVTDSFWSDYISIGGTREKYDKALNDLANRR